MRLGKDLYRTIDIWKNHFIKDYAFIYNTEEGIHLDNYDSLRVPIGSVRIAIQDDLMEELKWNWYEVQQ